MIRNLTQGEIVIYNSDRKTIALRIPSEGDPTNRTNAITGQVVVEKVDGVPIVDVILGKVNLPEEDENTFLVVNRITAEVAAAQGRTTSDLLVPMDPVRDCPSEGDDGTSIIIGWCALARPTS